MTVKELILALQMVDNQDLDVYVYTTEGEVCSIKEVDFTLTDRIDLNIDEGVVD